MIQAELIRAIIREELAAFFATAAETPATAKVIPMARQLEIRRQAENDMAAKMRKTGQRGRL